MQAKIDKYLTERTVLDFRVVDIIFWAFVLINVGWVLSLPVFPSQDGPHHLYIVDIFRKLLFHANQSYRNIYFIGRYLPPYSIYYYSLIGLELFVRPAMADKILVCIYIVSFALSMRLLLNVVDPEHSYAQLLILPVLINWTLMMGFINYLLGLAIALSALAFWSSHADRTRKRTRVGFLALTILTLFTHPVAWLFLETFVFFELGTRLLRWFRAKHSSILRTLQLDVPIAVASAFGVFYLESFHYIVSKTNPLQPEQGSFLLRTGHHLSSYISEHGLTVFADVHSTGTILYRILLAICFASVSVLAIQVFRRHVRSIFAAREPATYVTWAVFALLFLVAEPCIPSQLNGSAFFGQRLLLPLYLCLLMAATPLLRRNRLAIVLGALACGLTILSLGLAIQRINPVAREISNLNQIPVINSARPGLIVANDHVAADALLSFDPFSWAAATYFRDHELILYNTAWLEQSHIPIKVKPDAAQYLDRSYQTNPPMIGEGEFNTSAHAKNMLNRIGFVVGPVSSKRSGDDYRYLITGRRLASAWAGWHCSVHDIWELCLPD